MISTDQVHGVITCLLRKSRKLWPVEEGLVTTHLSWEILSMITLGNLREHNKLTARLVKPEAKMSLSRQKNSRKKLML